MNTLFNNRILIIDDNEAIHEDFKKSLILDADQSKNEMEKLENLFLGKSVEGDSKQAERPVFVVECANQGQKGIEYVDAALAKGLPYALAFIDMRMPPGLDGLETIEQIWKIDPDIQTVICTAYSDYSWEDIFKRLGHSDRLLILKKPFDIVEVRLMALALTKKWVLNKQANLKMNELHDMVDKKTEELENAFSLTKATLESTADGVVVIDKNQGISICNQNFLKMWGVPEFLINQHKVSEVIKFIEDKIEKNEKIPFSIEQIEDEKLWETFRELRLKTNEYVEMYLKPHYNKSEKVGIVYSFRDISQKKRLELELAKQASFDFLTGLPNRTLLVDRIQRAIANAKRNNTSVAVLLLDLDSFKLVNDSFGHETGDVLLKLFGQRLTRCLRETDTIARIVDGSSVARLGGDEFVIVLSLNTKNASELNIIIERLYKIFLEPYQIEDHHFTIGLSTGISLYPKDGDNASILMRHADMAMYHAKNRGKGSIEFYTEKLEQLGLPRLEFEHDLRYAIEKNELYIDYQPLFNISKNTIVSMEALVRWKHPKLGLIGPSTFIPIAESTGLIIPIGYWVLKTACAQAKAWQDMGFPPIRMSVNMSGFQFNQNDMVEIVKKVLEETGLDSKYLDLEITESSILSDINGVFMKIQKLNAMNINVNIDDFGTGYSSLSYIKQFPVDKIKIDQSFIRDLCVNKDSRAIVEAILMIAKSLNIRVVAEGVETQEQLDILNALSISEVQGFFLSKPVSGTEAGALLKKQRDN